MPSLKIRATSMKDSMPFWRKKTAIFSRKCRNRESKRKLTKLQVRDSFSPN
jgi:hypothetical protein